MEYKKLSKRIEYKKAEKEKLKSFLVFYFEKIFYTKQIETKWDKIIVIYIIKVNNRTINFT